MVSSAASSYAIYALVFLAVLLVFGVPAILRKVTLPADFSWAEIQEPMLTPTSQKLFKKTDAIAMQLFFQPVKIFTIPKLPQQNENKLYYSADAATGFLVSAINSQQRVIPVLEFATRFEDGTELDTTNAPVTVLFSEPPWRSVARFPGLTDLGKLHDAHKLRVEEKKAQGIAPHYTKPEDMMEEIRQSQVRQMDYQVEQGILRKDEQANVYRATPKIALRGVVAFINPFADDFTLKKFLIGAALGVALTVAWVFLVDYLSLENQLKGFFPAYSPAQITFLAFCPGFVLAGMALGWQFPQKGFLWGFIISIPGIFLLPAAATNPLVFSLVAAMSGYTANKLHGPEPINQKFARLFGALVVLTLLIVVYFRQMK